MELRHLRYFVAVAQELSFSGAARRLHVTQPALGRQIRDLEQEVGERLFARDRQRVSLTDPGRVLFGDAQAILVAVEQAVAHTREAAHGDRGLLRIGCITRLSTSFLSRSLHAFRKLHPSVDIELVELAIDDQIDALRRGDIEIAFRPTEPDVQATSDLTSWMVLRLSVVAVLPANHPAAADARVALGALREEQFLRYQSQAGTGYDRYVRKLCRECGGFAVRMVGAAVDNLETLFGLIAAGRGVAVLPKVFLRKPREGDGWMACSLRAPVPVFEIAGVWRTDNPSLILKNYVGVLSNGSA